MKVRWVLGALAASAILLWTSCSNSSSIPANTSLIWVAEGDQMVHTYKINQENGKVEPVGNDNGNPVATGVQPTQMIITPDGKTMFMVNSGGNGNAGGITAYNFRGDGSLIAAGNPVSAGETPIALALDPAGKFLFVANQGAATDVTSGTVSVFSVSGSNLNLVGAFPTETAGDSGGTGPSAVVVAPAGNYIYVANEFSNTVESLSFDGSGNLSLIAKYTAGANPSGLAFSRCAGFSSSSANSNCTAADGDNLFVANSGSNNISIFSACIQMLGTCTTPDGTLTEISSGSPVPAGVGPSTFLIDAIANYVYVVDRGSDDVYAYQYSPATGALSFLGTGPGGTAVFSGGITGNVANQTTSFNWIGLSNTGVSTLSIFRVAITGKLLPLSSGQYALQGQPSAILMR
ncbi:MAG TPA: beta-propeller fold lactonase family protein [Terriglobales bacterium]|nr:beta-propeller fold lactonase family protein [Terriglobales bacterium]